jgi:HEAT repeat protein
MKLLKNARVSSRKLRYVLVLSALVSIGILIALSYVNLPKWKPEWVIAHSKSPDRILRASYFAFNGHFEATPALKNLLGERFDEFLVGKLSDPDDAKREQAACILAYSDDPIAEEALIEAYHRESSEDLKLSILFFLGWTATDKSRDFLVAILERRVEGARWSALRSLGMSSISDRYEAISSYLNDSDKRVREEAESALEIKEEDEFEAELARLAESMLFPLAKGLVGLHQDIVPQEELPRKLAGRALRWGRVYRGVLDLRFEDDKHGILINPSGGNTFPMVNGYLIGGGGVRGITPYSAF